MENEVRIARQRMLIEELGRHFDKEGMQPIAGRILGLLMVMDKEQYTFDEITEELQISKGSTSNVLRNLELRGSIEYITLPGDRKKYYRIKTHDTFTIMNEYERKLTQFREMTTRVYDLKKDKTSRNSKFLHEMSSIIDFFLARMGQLRREYETRIS